MNLPIRTHIRYLADRLAIEELVSRYAHAVDRHDVPLMEGVYHPDAWDEHGAFRGGIDAFTGWVNGLHERKTIAHTHNITTHVADIDGDVAHADSYVLFVLSLRATDKVMIGTGRYIDRLARRDGRWRIELRVTLTEARIEVDRSAGGTMFGSAPMGSWDRGDPAFALLSPEPRSDRPAAATAPPLADLAARRAVRDLVMQAARGLDRRDEALFLAQFAPDADIVVAGAALSPEAALRRSEAAGLFDNLAHTHNVTTQRVVVDGDRATATSRLIRMVRHNDRRSVGVEGLEYRDTCRLGADGWRIVRREAASDWSFDGDGTLFEDDDGYRHGRRDRSDESYARPLVA